MLLATAFVFEVVGVALFVGFYIVPFFFARRIAKPKGFSWFWWAFFLGWIGVLVLAVRQPKVSVPTASGGGYHKPSERARGRPSTKDELLYGKRRG